MKMTRHHKKPRSRGGKGKQNNIVKFPWHIHKAWHTIFGNLTPGEAKILIDIVFRSEKKAWRPEDLYEVQLNIQTGRVDTLLY